MHQHRFIRRVASPGPPDDNAHCYLFVGDRLLLVEDADHLRIPDIARLTVLGLSLPELLPLGELDGVACLVGELQTVDGIPGVRLVDLREAHGLLPKHGYSIDIEYAIAGYAVQIAHWERTTRFCPVCGSATEIVPGERAKRCPACGFLQYTRVSPCIIVLIHRPGQVLLTRQPSWPPNRYSLVAGFVEPGESLEQAVRREIAEEVGVTVDEIRYLGSQPWPFPHQLMVGYLARYAAGEIAIDEAELEHAAWFNTEALPDLPPPLSISRKIIDWHLQSLADPSLPFPAD